MGSNNSDVRPTCSATALRQAVGAADGATELRDRRRHQTSSRSCRGARELKPQIPWLRVFVEGVVIRLGVEGSRASARRVNAVRTSPPPRVRPNRTAPGRCSPLRHALLAVPSSG